MDTENALREAQSIAKSMTAKNWKTKRAALLTLLTTNTIESTPV